MKSSMDKGNRAHAPVRFRYRLNQAWNIVEFRFERVQNDISSET